MNGAGECRGGVGWRRILWAVLIIVALAWAVSLRKRETGGGDGFREERRDPPPARSAAVPKERRDRGRATSPARNDDAGRRRIRNEILRCRDDLRLPTKPEEAEASIALLRERIRGEPDEAGAASAIVEFLNGGDDAATGLPFVVGRDGAMASVPTLRVALLDLLPALDPSAALESARGIVRRMESQDEYALALRNLAWNDLDGDLAAELGAAFDRMMGNRSWLERPGPGFLEALDVALVVADRGRFQKISGIAASRPPETGDPMLHACCMTLDRMVLRDPALLTGAWDGGDWLGGLPEQRASLMSRLDPTRPADRRVMLDYLTKAGVGARERELFILLFPNGNHLYSHRLVSTDEGSLTIGGRREKDREILAAVVEMENAAPEAAASSLARIRWNLERLSAE